jgi:hypothetical protein
MPGLMRTRFLAMGVAERKEEARRETKTSAAQLSCSVGGSSSLPTVGASVSSMNSFLDPQEKSLASEEVSGSLWRSCWELLEKLLGNSREVAGEKLFLKMSPGSSGEVAGGLFLAWSKI